MFNWNIWNIWNIWNRSFFSFSIFEIFILSKLSILSKVSILSKMEKILSHLLPHQIAHTGRIFRYFKALPPFRMKTHVYLDASATGTGKTYTSIALCALMGYSPIIVCPKSVVHVWQEVSSIFKVRAEIFSYEEIIGGKTPIYDKSVWRFAGHGMIIFDEAHRCKIPIHSIQPY